MSCENKYGAYYCPDSILEVERIPKRLPIFTDQFTTPMIGAAENDCRPCTPHLPFNVCTNWNNHYFQDIKTSTESMNSELSHLYIVAERISCPIWSTTHGTKKGSTNTTNLAVWSKPTELVVDFQKFNQHLFWRSSCCVATILKASVRSLCLAYSENLIYSHEVLKQFSLVYCFVKPRQERRGGANIAKRLVSTSNYVETAVVEF